MVIDRYEACRYAATALIEDADDELAVIASASAGEDAIEMVERVKPDTILVGLDGTDDERLLAELRRSAPNARIMVVSDRADAPALLGAVRSGATGFVPKSTEPRDVLSALRTVANGGVALHPSVTGDGVVWAARRLGDAADASARYWHLTKRERETLGWLSRGMTAREIGSRMGVSRRTAERHLANAYKKLGAHNRHEAVREYNRLAELAS